MTLSEAIKSARVAAKVSQAELARRLSVTPAYVWQLENGRSTGLTAEKLYALCDALGVTCDHFRPFISPALVAPVAAVPPPAALPVRGRAKKA